MSNFSEAASAAPVVLWSPSCSKKEEGGNIYLQKKNTFLEFYTDEHKQTQGSAHQRSFSHDGVCKRDDCQTPKKVDKSVPSDSSMPSTPSLISFAPSVCSLDTSSQHDSQHGDSTPKHWINDCSFTPPSELESPKGQATGAMNFNTRQSWCDMSEDREQNDVPNTWMSEVAVQVIPVIAQVPMTGSFNEQAPWLQPSSLNESYYSQAARPSSQKAALKQKKKSDLTKLNPIPSDYSDITTLMIRGIPCSFSEGDILHLLGSAGLGDKYDFFYMPWAGKNGSNLGYAFVNFTKTLHAWTCAFTFNGIQLDPERSVKICTVSPADIQGTANLKKHFRCTLVSRGAKGPKFVGNNRRKNQNRAGREGLSKTQSRS